MFYFRFYYFVHKKALKYIRQLTRTLRKKILQDETIIFSLKDFIKTTQKLIIIPHLLQCFQGDSANTQERITQGKKTNTIRNLPAIAIFSRLWVQMHTKTHASALEHIHAYINIYRGWPGISAQERGIYITLRFSCEKKTNEQEYVSAALMSTQLLLHTVADWFHMNPPL